MKSDPLSRWIISCIHVLITLPRYSTLVRSGKLSPYQSFFWRTIPKVHTPKIFWQKFPFSLKSIRQIAPLFEERVITSMRTGYTFNAPGEKYRQLGEL